MYDTCDNLIEVKNLCKRYSDFSLKEVSFDVPSGYVTGFIGPNGAGKTTTIKSILNMVRPDSGELRVLGAEVGERRVGDQVGVVMDAPFYVDEWSITDVESAVAPFYTQWDHDCFNRRLREYNIAADKRVKELSRGMKVKLMLAVALSHGARLLILDEPTSGLDPVARDELCDALSDFVTDENRSVLFSTHITSDLEKIADYIVFILNGRIIYSGTKEKLLESYALVKGGLGDLERIEPSALIGLRKHATGFEAVTALSGRARLPGGVMVEPVSLDELIIFMDRGAGK
jgi:ABC-2 type transport system ATP-binding protein